MIDRTMSTRILVSLSLLALVSTSAQAAPRSWQDFGDNINWGSAINWAPIGTPQSSDNILIGDHANAAGDQTVINQDYTIATLAITNAASANTDGNRLIVNGNILISGADSVFFANEHDDGATTVSVIADDINLITGGAYEMANGRTLISGSFSVGSGAELRGYGVVTADRFYNDGSITATSATELLRLRAMGPGVIDLDGASETGTVTALSGSIFFDDDLLDPFDSTITAGGSYKVSFATDVTIGSAGVVNLQGGSTLQTEFGVFGAGVVSFQGTLNASVMTKVSNLDFSTGATINLTSALDELTVRGPNSAVDAGVAFNGSGSIVVSGGTLTLREGAQVSVPVTLGTSSNLRIGDASSDPIAAAEVLAFTSIIAGDLEIDLGGDAFAEYDRLTVSSQATLGGELEVSLINGFMPSAGDNFQIISSLGSPISGQFVTTANDLPALSGNLYWEIDYSDSDFVFLRVLSPLAEGDGNLDGMVDGLDYLLWAANFGDDPADDPPGSPENGDYNDDGMVDGLDYLVWAGNFGGGATTAVPEPGTFALVVIGLVTCLSTRRRLS